MSRRVLVVGGGITGLTVAHTLAASATPGTIEIEVREADDRLGGKLHTSPFAGLPAVDEGADAFLARVPHATALCAEVGLAGELTSPTDATAAVWFDGLHPIPEGLLLGVPADLLRLSTTSLLSIRGKLRAAAEPLLPGRDPADSIGALVRGRFGDEVHERLVDALIGSIYAADTDRFSLAMVPQLATLAGRGRSLLLSARRQRADVASTERSGLPGPPWRDGGARRGRGGRRRAAGRDDPHPLSRQHARRRRAALAGRRRSVRRRRAGDTRRADRSAGRPSAPDTARLLAQMDHAGVVLVTLAVANWPARLRGRSGYLVPKPVQRTVTAASFGSQKWAHWQGGDGEVLRVSLGSRRPAGRPPGRSRGPRPRGRRGRRPPRHRPPADGHPGLPLAGCLPPVPPPPPALAGGRRRLAARRACSSPGPATAGSGCRRASPRPGPPPLVPPPMWASPRRQAVSARRGRPGGTCAPRRTRGFRRWQTWS